MLQNIIVLSLLIAVVIILRAVFKKKVSAKLIYALWIAVVIKLCIPVSFLNVLPQIDLFPDKPAEISVATPAADETPSAELTYVQPDTAVTEPVDHQTVPVDLVPDVTPTTHDVTTPDVTVAPVIEPDVAAEHDPAADPVIEPEPTPTRSFDLTRALYIAWGVCSVAAALFFIVNGAVFYTKLRRTREYVGKMHNVNVYSSPATETPCVFGLVPSIYLTPDVKDSSAYSLALSHEWAHIRQGDNMWAIVRILALIIYPWNPLVWAAAILSKRDSEFACDEAVTEKLDRDDRLNYAQMLVNSVNVKPRGVVGLGSAPLNERIKAVTEKRKTSVIAFILALTLTFSAVGCSFIGTKEKTPDGNITDDLEDLAKKESDYAAAVALYKSGNYKEARAAFYRLGDYRNSVKYYLSIDARPCTTVYQGNNFTTLTTRNYDGNGNLLSEYIDHGSHEVIEEKREYTYDEKGRILTSYRGDDFGSGTETYTYTDSGYTMIRDVVGKNGLTERYAEYYNDKGLCVKSAYTRGDGSGSITETEYDGNGIFIKSYSADFDGNFISSSENEYDEHGNVISMIQKTYRNVDTYFRTYDDHGNITSDKHIFPDGTEELSERRYRYDEYGNTIYEVIRGENGKTVTETTFEGIEPYGSGFCYGKKTVNTTYTSKNGSVAYSGKQVYDPSERLLYYFRDDGETQITEEYTYDVFGNPLEAVTEEKNLKSNKTERSSIIYTYDEDGNLIKYESTGDNKHSSTEEYSDFVYFVKNPLVFDEKIASEETKTVLLNTVTTATTPFGTHKYVDEYDEYGRRIKSTTYTDGEEYSVTEYTYDEYGYQNSEKFVTAELSYIYKWTNNADGNRLKGTEKTEQSNGLSSFESEFEYKYDKKGRVVSYDCTTVSKTAMTSGKAITEQYRTYEYTDKYGSYTMMERGDNIPETVHLCQFDENGNIDEEIVLTDGYETMRTKFDSHGYSLTLWRKTASGEEVTSFENSYENDLLTKMIKKNEDGKIISTTTITYDGNGNPLSTVITGEDGTETSNTVYEYEKFEVKVFGNGNSPVDDENVQSSDALSGEKGNIGVNIISRDTPLFVKSKRYFSAQEKQKAENHDAVQLAAIYDNIAGTYLTDYVFVLGNYGIQGVSTKENGEAEYLIGKQIVNNGTDKSEKVCIYKTDPFEILYDGNGMEWPTFVYDGKRIIFYDSFRGRARDVVSSDGGLLHTDDAYNSLDLLSDGNLILCGENSFTVYDMDFKVVHESKKYDYVLYDAQANYLYVRVDGKMMLTDAYETYLKPYEAEMLQKLTVTNEQHVLGTSYPFLETNQFMDIFVRFFHDEYSKGDELKGNALYATALLCITAANNEHATFSIPESVDGRYGTISRRDLEYIAKKILGEGVDLTKYHSTFTGTYDGYFPDEEAYHFGNGTDWWHDDPCVIYHDTVVIEEDYSKLVYSARIDIYDEQFSDIVAESKYLTYTFKKVCDNELMYLRLVSIEDTASCEIVSERTPDFTDGMAAVECDVYPFPDDSTKSIGIMWLHKRVFVEAVATVRNTITGEVSDWYQISCTDKHGNAARFTGWVPASCVEKYDENASVPDNALYQIKMGAEYTIDGVTKTFDKDSMNVTMSLDRTEENGRMRFTTYGGSTVMVNSKDCVEQNDRLIPPAWANVP